MHWWFPGNASSVGGKVDSLFYVILYITGAVFVLVEATHLGLEAKQFEWHVTYPGPDGKLGTDDDFLKKDSIHLVVNRDYVLEMTARDVVHSLFVPAFRLKQDLVPGMNIKMWIRPTRTGTFEMACSELCGLGHYRMRGVVVVHAPQDYAAWLVSQGEASAADSAAASPASAVQTPTISGKGAP